MWHIYIACSILAPVLGVAHVTTLFQCQRIVCISCAFCRALRQQQPYNITKLLHVVSSVKDNFEPITYWTLENNVMLFRLVLLDFYFTPLAPNPIYDDAHVSVISFCMRAIDESHNQLCI